MSFPGLPLVASGQGEARGVPEAKIATWALWLDVWGVHWLSFPVLLPDTTVMRGGGDMCDSGELSQTAALSLGLSSSPGGVLSDWALMCLGPMTSVR